MNRKALLVNRLGLLMFLAVIAGCGKASEDEYSVQSLIKALQSENSEVRYSAAKTLGTYGSAEGGVLPALRAAIKDPDASVRLSVVYAFSQIGPPAAPALPELKVALLQDVDKDVRQAAALALGMLGFEGRDALSALNEAVRTDRDPEVRTEAQKSVTAIQSKIPGLTRK